MSFFTHVHCIGCDILWLTFSMSHLSYWLLSEPHLCYLLVFETTYSAPVNHFFFVNALNCKAMQFRNFVVAFEQNLMRDANSWYVGSLEGGDVWVQWSML